jgi:hypothetical protein
LATDVTEAMLAFAPQSAENLAAAAQLDVSVEEDDFGRSDLGLCLKDYGVRLGHVLWLADGVDMPEQVRGRWPGLLQHEWDCALRVAKLILSALGSPSIQDGKAVPQPAQAGFRAALWAIGEQPHTPPVELGGTVGATLLAFASATPDNLAAVEHLSVSVQEEQAHWDVGLCVRRPVIRLSHLLASAVGSTMPPALLEDLPELIQEDWDTVFSVTALVLSALESDRLETASHRA